MKPKVKGEFTEIKILLELLKLGFIVSKPNGDSAPYDFIVDDGIKLTKVQCKTARAASNEGALEFNTKSIRINTKKTYATSYAGKIDLFAVYYPVLDKVYFVPYSAVSSRHHAAILRYESPKNGQLVETLLAENFEQWI